MTEGYDYVQLNQRSRHGGLTWEEVRLTAERSVKERLRSTTDKRLLDAMTPKQEKAFFNIATAHAIINAGMGAKGTDYARVKGGSGDVDYGAALTVRYKEWVPKCKAKYVSHLMALDIIVMGMSLNESDQFRKMRHGTAKQNLMNCLDLW